LLFKPSGDAGINNYVSANLIMTKENVNLSFIKAASGSLSVVCEEKNDPLREEILQYPHYEEILCEELKEYCDNFKNTFGRDIDEKVARKALQGYAATKLLQDHGDPKVREILETFSKRAHQSALFILQAPAQELAIRLGEDYAKSMEKQFTDEIPKEWITHILLPNPGKEMTDFLELEIDKLKVKFQFVDSQDYYPSIMLGQQFTVNNVRVSCPNYEEALKNILASEVGPLKRCLTHISRVGF